MKIVLYNAPMLHSATIEFTPEELQFLHDLLRGVGGTSRITRRRIADEILDGLQRLPGMVRHEYGAPDQSGSIYYK